MKTSIILLSLALAACGGNPVKTSFPDAPEALMATPQPLVTIPTQVKTLTDGNIPSGIPLSVLGAVMVQNYTTCSLYKEQIFGLQTWILEQKAINP